MNVLEKPTEDEAYLYALLTDESGLDQAEFCWVDHEAPEGVWRAWPFQWRWFRNNSPLQIDQCGRSVGKSLSIKMRAFAFPFLHPGQEMVITAPELVHLNPIVGLVENQFLNTRLGREMLPKGRNRGITHRPFQMDFLNGSRIIGRIPQRDGKGVKGVHPLWLELDEGQDFPDPGWIEVIETLKRGHAGAVWRAHGVTKGVRDYFYKFTQPESGWVVHRFSAMHRPTWSDQERKEKIEQYGSKDHPDYRRNINGLHGDATNPLFVLHRLMQCVDQKQDSDYNQSTYQHFRINHEYLMDRGDGIINALQFPDGHKTLAKSFWAGMDVGYCLSFDTEILTRRGWLTYDQIEIGSDQTLSIDPATGKSSWQTISDVYSEHFDHIPMVEMQGQSFSSLSTPHHRWLVQPEGSTAWRWKQTRTLNSKDRIPLTAQRGDASGVPVVRDEVVELAAWYWTEGCCLPYGAINLSQSIRKNPEFVSRIDLCLTTLFGAPGLSKGLPSVAGWSRRELDDGMIIYYLSRLAAQTLTDIVVGSEKIISPKFLASLTVNQLNLFIETSIDADGWRTPSGALKIEQHSEARIRSFEIACALAGLPTSTSYDPKRDRYHVSILQCATVRPVKSAQFPRQSEQAMTINEVDYSGTIWCPTVQHGNWLARRNGSIYFTGNTNHPSEILVFGDIKNVLTLLTRIHLERIAHGSQVEAILHVIRWYGVSAFSMDKTGLGLPLFQDIQERAPHFAPVIKGYNFSQKILVDFDQTVEVDEFRGDLIKEAGMERNVLEYASDQLRGLVDQKKILLPWDRDLLGEFQGQTYTVVRDTMNLYGKKTYSAGTFHALDAARMAVLGKVQTPIEAFVKQDQWEPVPDLFL